MWRASSLFPFPPNRKTCHLPADMNKQKFLYFLCLVFSLYATALYAQEKSIGFTVKGYAFSAEPNGLAPLPGAEIIAWEKDSVPQLIGIAGENGYFECFTPKRPVKVQIRHLGYAPRTIGVETSSRRNISLRSIPNG